MSITPDKFYALRQRAEQILCSSSTLLSIQSKDDIQAVLHELDTYRIELELQNDELVNTYKQLQDIHQDYLNLYHFAPIGYVSLTSNGYIRHTNVALLNLLGLTSPLPPDTLFNQFILDNDQDIFYLHSQAILDKQPNKFCEFRLVNAQGNILWIRCEGFFIHQSAPDDINCVITDITAIKKMEDDLRLGASIFDGSDEGMMIAGSDLTILKVNFAYSLITGYSQQEVIGKKTNFLRSDKHDAIFYQDMWSSINETDHWQGEIWNKRKNGELYPEWLNIVARKNNLNQVTHYIGIFSDLTNHKNSENLIHYLAYYDALTQLPNRILLQDRIHYALSHSQRTGQYCALMLLDLDYFKVINDSLGHEVGDRLLIEVATRLTTTVREEDTVARLGGDEFVVLLQTLDANKQIAEQKAIVIADKICKKLAEPIRCDNHILHISVSIGITAFKDKGENAADLIKNADNAMYQAKEAGRNKYELYSLEMKQKADSRLIIENELRNAIKRHELELYFQAQTNIKNNIICGAEVLLRWNHPTKGLVPPIEFIAIAELSGLIIPIGTWVLQKACLFMAAWQKLTTTKDIEYIAVNVSPHQFQQKDFVDIVMASVIDADIDANCLVLELTEGVLIQNIGDTLEKLKALISFGVRIAIDDFGTGYSSLNYLKRFPLDVLKIDQSFVKDITSDSNDAAIVQTIIALANNLNLKVMAEGVETAEQLNFLRDRKCDTYQGYFCSKPIPEPAFIALLEHQLNINPIII